jgi:hypothetical protein
MEKWMRVTEAHQYVGGYLETGRSPIAAIFVEKVLR